MVSFEYPGTLYFLDIPFLRKVGFICFWAACVLKSTRYHRGVFTSDLDPRGLRISVPNKGLGR